MSFSTFNPKQVDNTKQPMMFGEGLNVARFDHLKYEHIDEQFTQRQLGFFWRPEEIDLSKDRIDFNEKLSAHERHLFTSNLKYQTLLDSVQSRGLEAAFGKIITLPELENWFQTWSFSETIHSRSYTHIIRNLYVNPGVIFDDIVLNPEIAERTLNLTNNYDRFIRGVDMWSLFGEGRFIVNQGSSNTINEILANPMAKPPAPKHLETFDISMPQLMNDAYYMLADINTLEALRFYVSFACSFSFNERELMEGNAKVIKLICRDESLHKTSTTWMLNKLASGAEGQEWAKIARAQNARVVPLVKSVVEQEIRWARYLFKDGSMPGINLETISAYIEYLADVLLDQLHILPAYGRKKNPMPWMSSYTNSDNVQVAPQEVELSSYLTADLKMDGLTELGDLTL